MSEQYVQRMAGNKMKFSEMVQKQRNLQLSKYQDGFHDYYDESDRDAWLRHLEEEMEKDQYREEVFDRLRQESIKLRDILYRNTKEILDVLDTVINSSSLDELPGDGGRIYRPADELEELLPKLRNWVEHGGEE